MSTWVRTDRAGGLHLYELDDAALAAMFETAKRVERPEIEASCDCCGWAIGPGEDRLPCEDSECVARDCDVCTDPTCPCCATVSLECLDEEPEG